MAREAITATISSSSLSATAQNAISSAAITSVLSTSSLSATAQSAVSSATVTSVLITGASGGSGSAGTSGLTNGTSGSSGTSGVNGTSGGAGTSGSSGSSGASGASGTSGSSGGTGASGSSGSSGSCGTSGSAGTSGSSGSSGSSGANGTSGSSGSSGANGTSGSSGSSGGTGASGSSGSSGGTGATGSSGSSGGTGASGSSGSSGDTGASGSSGSSGDTGSSGSSGASGSSGDNPWHAVFDHINGTAEGRLINYSSSSKSSISISGVILEESNVPDFFNFYTKEGYSRGVHCSTEPIFNTSIDDDIFVYGGYKYVFGLDAHTGVKFLDELTTDYCWHLSYGFTGIPPFVRTANVNVNGSTLITTGFSSGDIFYINYDGQKVRFFIDNELVTGVDRPISGSLYLAGGMGPSHKAATYMDWYGEFRDIAFGPMGESASKEAIVPYGSEFVSLYCTEMPEVRFDDIISIKTNGRLNIIEKIDPVYYSVCEKKTIKAISYTCSEPAICGVKIERDNIMIKFSEHDPVPDELIIKLSAIRKGFNNERFTIKTKEQMIKNNEFWMQSKI